MAIFVVCARENSLLSNQSVGGFRSMATRRAKANRSSGLANSSSVRESNHWESRNDSAKGYTTVAAWRPI
jgi:hypothetical protein